MDLRFVYVTASSAAEAETIGRLLVESGVAACANIVPGVKSIFRWQGQVEVAEEALLVCKTDSAHVEALIAAVKKTHSYEVPCVVTLPILEGNPAYLRWVADSLV